MDMHCVSCIIQSWLLDNQRGTSVLNMFPFQRIVSFMVMNSLLLPRRGKSLSLFNLMYSSVQIQ